MSNSSVTYRFCSRIIVEAPREEILRPRKLPVVYAPNARYPIHPAADVQVEPSKHELADQQAG
jgi:hypothetical protein